MLLLNKEDIKRVFSMKDAIEADKEAFKLLSLGKSVVPLRTVIQAQKYEGTMLYMPGYIEDMDAAALKIVSIFPKNMDMGKPTAPATVLLMDGTTGEVSAILDGTYVTQLRTGAASGAAFDLFALKDSKKGALIGTGGQAAAQLEGMLAARKLDMVMVFDTNKERTIAFAKKMQEELNEYGVRIIPAASSDEAVTDADMVVTVTPSLNPVFDGDKIKEGAVVSCVGSYQHHMQEMDPRLLTRASKIYFDSKDAVLSEAGDILIPLEKGIITEEDFTGDIGEVILGKAPGRENCKEIIVFKTVGVAVQDLVTAKKIYDIALKENIGTKWS
ncbi:MAG: ornithine cyclodeaminase family protein [Solirubrobacterales bacterium]